MNSFRRAFGIEAMDMERESRQIGGESPRIAKVREQVEAQAVALSIWWKVALQTNLQQRMWMKLGQLGPSESLLPSKYERLYQPDKIAQFDRFFARGWATPLRRSHSAQHVDGSEIDMEGNTLTRALHRRPYKPDSETKDSSQPETLSDVRVSYQGVKTLSSLVDFYDKSVRKGDQSDFLGSIDFSEGSVSEEYQRYCEPPSKHIFPVHRERAVAEFQMRLEDCSLGADDVKGIRKVRWRSNEILL